MLFFLGTIGVVVCRHTAARRDNYESVLLLVTRGGRLDVLNKEGHLPLQVCPDKQCHSALLLALNTKLQQLTKIPSAGRVEKLLSKCVLCPRYRSVLLRKRLWAVCSLEFRFFFF